MDEIKSDIESKVNMFKETKQHYINEFARIEAMIRRFDEVICEKASKLSLSELEKTIDTRFDRKAKNILTEVKGVEDTMLTHKNE